MSRRQAREVAMQALFQLEFNHGKPGEDQTPYISLAIDTALMEAEPKLREEDMAFARDLVMGTRERLKSIDGMLASLSKDWSLLRLAAVDRNLLRLSIYELKYSPEHTDKGVIINEAVEVAKKYGTDKSPGFVNGILGKVK